MFLRKHCKRCPSCFAMLDYTVESSWRDCKWAPTNMEHVIAFNFKDNCHFVAHGVGQHISKLTNMYNKTSGSNKFLNLTTVLGTRHSLRIDSKKHVNSSTHYYDCFGVFCYSCGYVGFESKEMLEFSMMYKANKVKW